jgi:hypothetical protein
MNLENARAMRHELQKTSIVIGDDDEDAQRWSTTSHTAMQSSADQARPADRDRMVQELSDRRLHNSKTSISFGNHKVRLSMRAAGRFLGIASKASGYLDIVAGRVSSGQLAQSIY